jgi:hypothetical protein
MKRMQLSLLSIIALSATILCPPAVQSEQVLNGQIAVCHIDRLTRDIHWCDSLDQAKDEAKKQGKMIFWMHMLGNISGST